MNEQPAENDRLRTVDAFAAEMSATDPEFAEEWERRNAARDHLCGELLRDHVDGRCPKPCRRYVGNACGSADCWDCNWPKRQHRTAARSAPVQTHGCDYQEEPMSDHTTDCVLRHDHHGACDSLSWRPSRLARLLTWLGIR